VSGILLDSSIIIAAERRTIELAAVTAGRLDLTHLSVITASELLHGVHRADRDWHWRR
jgi:predicted nucleic acid-binding protein